MGAFRKIGFACLGLFVGGMVGGGAGLLGGLLYTELASTRSFEGYSGYVVGYWLIVGAFIGLIVGPVLGWRFASARPGKPLGQNL